MIASYFTYYVIRPEGRRNFGDLIDPQRPLPSAAGLTRLKITLNESHAARAGYEADLVRA